MHFYCRPLNKCKFLSSNSTDSFSFSSELKAKTKKTTTTTTSATKEEIATYSEEQFAFKNDNTTVKPRKGVEENSPLEDLHAKSGVKPRKGVSTQDVPHAELLPTSLNKSNVKARKGVSNPTEVPQSSAATPKLAPHPVEDVNTKELMSELQKVFEDDTQTTSVESTSTSSVGISPTLASTQSAYTTNYEGSSEFPANILPSYTTESSQLIPNSRTKTSMDHSTVARQFVSAAVEEVIVPFSSSPTTILSHSTATIQSSKVPSPSSLGEGFQQELGQLSSPGEVVQQKVGQPSSLGGNVLQKLGQSSLEDGVHQELGQLSSVGAGSHEKLVSSDKDEESESDRRYKSSIHLVLALVFGLVVLFAVLGVVAKRVYDGWQRRNYSRMNYLIDGIYNGVD